VRTIPYSEFQRLAAEGRVTDLVVGETRISGMLRDAPQGEPRRFTTQRVDPAFAQSLAGTPVEFAGEPEPGLLVRAIGWVLPRALLLMLWMILPRRRTGGAGLMAIGTSNARVHVETDIKVTFADVAGMDEAKAERQEIVAFLKDPQGYGRLGARMPKGVLLVGPPGTGKTLIPRAVAGEAGVPFFSISGSEFVEMFVGVGAARVRDLFEQAQSRAPGIVFIDELDALGRARGAFGNLGGGHDEKEQTLNQLLTEMDGLDPRSGVILLGATNRPEILDPALLRAGRLDCEVLVDRPDRIGRAQILTVYLKKVRTDPALDREAIAALTPGFTGADLANLVNEAALLATRRGARHVEMRDIESAIERIIAGLETRNRLLTKRERETVAHHEMGHAIVAMALKGADPVEKVRRARRNAWCSRRSRPARRMTWRRRRTSRAPW
jgi:cell division protease FtsH